MREDKHTAKHFGKEIQPLDREPPQSIRAPREGEEPFPPRGEGGSTVGLRRMRIAYLTTQYPKVSHTFIRRELCELERRGHFVLRLAIRPAESALADDKDRAELRKTTQCLAQPVPTLLASLLRVALRRPRRFAAALRDALTMGRVSHRALWIHLAYLVEACFLLEQLERARIEHVHVHFGRNAATVALLVLKLGGPPYSLTIHGPGEWDAPVGLSLAAKMRAARFVVTISSFGAAQARRWLPPEHWSKLHVVHCAVDDRFFDGRVPVNPLSRCFVCVGRLTAQKAPLVLIEAFAELIESGAEAELVLVGDGELRAPVEASIDRHDLRGRVRVTGWLGEAEVRKELERARCFVLPSCAEGLPVVIMEALAMGRPVISTYVAGIPELVRPGQNGWLIPAGSARALTEAMREVLAMPIDRLQAMAEAGSERVRVRHSLTNEVSKLERLLCSEDPEAEAAPLVARASVAAGPSARRPA